MKTILIVDDEPHLRLLYETELRQAGYSTLSASNAEQCLESVTTMNPSLVILDIRMPGMDGIETLQRVQELNRQIPVIVHTAYSGYRDNYLTRAADAVLLKSSDSTELLDTVKKLLTGKSGETPLQNPSFPKMDNHNGRNGYACHAL